ncbi:MAG: hypothetical protein U0Q07_11745 [Acidimicrobiales bacterium]
MDRRRTPPAFVPVSVLVAVAAVVLAGCSSSPSSGDGGGGATIAAPTTTTATTGGSASTAGPGTTARRPPPTTPGPSTTTRSGSAAATVTRDDLGGIDPASLGELPTDAPYGRYATIRDDTGQVSAEVPVTWEHDGSIRTITEVDVPNVVAAPLLQDYYDDRTSPGMRLAAYQGELADKGIDWALRHEGEVDHLDRCTGTSETTPFSLGSREGTAQVTTGCGRSGDVTVVQVAAATPDGGDLAVLQVALVSTADVAALATILGSMAVP